MKRLFLILIIGFIFTAAVAQTPLVNVGVQMNAGRLYSSSKIIDPNPYALSRKDLFSLAELGIFVEKRRKTIGINLSTGYSYQRMRFQDPNAEYFSAGEQQLFYTATSSGIYSTLGISKYVAFNNTLAAYGKFGLRGQFGSSSEASATGNMKSSLIGDIPVTTTVKNSSFGFGLNPEIGIQLQKNNHAWTFFVQQNIGLTDAAQGQSVRDVLGTKVNQSEFTSQGSYTSLGVRYSFNINKKEKTDLVAKEKKPKEPRRKKTKDSTATEDKKITYNEQGLPEKLDDRIIEKQNEVLVKSTEIEFFVWDDKQEDQDSISLYINGQWVLKNFEITKKKKSVKVTIDPNRDNYLIMYALNEGKFPPNTCAISIDDGSGEKRMYLKSSLNSCGALQFRYKPKE